MKPVSIDRVEKHFVGRGGTVHALGPIDLEVASSEFLAVVGPSGCGKSTLLQLLAGLDSPTAGQILVDGQPIQGPSPERTVVFQKFALFPSMTVFKNVEFGLKMTKVEPSKRRALVQSQLEAVGLDDFAASYPHQLSGGMQQRVAIARALVMNPEVLLMDEPFGALDAQTRTVMQEDLAHMTEKARTTTVLITHSVEEATYLADRVAVMTSRPGKLKRVIPNPGAARWRSQGMDVALEDPEFQKVREEAWALVREEITVPGRKKPSKVEV